MLDMDKYLLFTMFHKRFRTNNASKNNADNTIKNIDNKTSKPGDKQTYYKMFNLFNVYKTVCKDNNKK